LLKFDHLVIAASTLEQGMNWLETKLGVKMQAGGKHPSFGTHNALLKLKESVYLEVISVDPEASNPSRARWFELDQSHLLEQPKLIHWVARTEQLENRVLEFPELGRVLEASRGDLHWQITVPDDGHLNFEGLIPTLISWRGIHPTSQLEDQNCKLLQLQGYHPEPNLVNDTLERLGAKSLLEVFFAPIPNLQALIQTPNGRVKL
jgi:Glyoxalase-like domain